MFRLLMLHFQLPSFLQFLVIVSSSPKGRQDLRCMRRSQSTLRALLMSNLMTCSLIKGSPASLMDSTG